MGKVNIKCDYDGVYGEVNIFGKEDFSLRLTFYADKLY